MFTYKISNSPLHKIPAWIKILVVPVLSVAVFLFPWYVALSFVLIQFLTACFLSFSIKEQFEDLKPVLFYICILYPVRFVSFALGVKFDSFSKLCSQVFLDKELALVLLKLTCIIQGASLIFRTSSSIQLREGIGVIEHAIRKILPFGQKNTVTNVLAMFVCFIPMVSEVWNQSKKAWYCRGGKKGIKMYTTLLPVLFSVGMKKAYSTARAVFIRSE